MGFLLGSFRNDGDLRRAQADLFLELRRRKCGLVLEVGGYYRNVFTLFPSFTMTREEMDLALELLGQLFGRCRAQ